MSKTWSGSAVRTARARWRPVVHAGEAICWRCNRLIVPDPSRKDEGWHVGHVEDRWAGGDMGATNQLPEHARCNLRAGGQVGARITNARRGVTPNVHMAPESDRRIRGGRA